MFFSNRILREITDEFIGDSDNPNFKYKSGPILVTFVNSFFNQNDSYSQGFPSRWKYLYDYLEEIDEKKMEKFFQFILSEQYLRREENIPKESIFHFIEESIKKFNNIIDLDGYKLNRINGVLRLVNIDTDLVFINSGGFAEVYHSKSTGYAIKKLKDDIRFDEGVRHRFKREYEITKDLSDIFGVIPVYHFREQELAYEMLYCTKTLEDIINDGILTEPEKDTIIDFILGVMEQVHNRNVIHRDLSLNNVLFNRGEYYISDFGLGKSLGKEYTHHTINTMGVGQLLYVAPEQINSLAESNKYSDVFSLGKMINAILTGNPRNDNHKYQSLCIKATATSILARYQDATELKKALKKFRERKTSHEFEVHILNQLQNREYTEDIELYIQGLSYSEIAEYVVQKNGFKDILIIYIQRNPNTTINLLESLLDNCASVVSTFEDADLFGGIGYSLLKDKTVKYSYDLKVAAAKLLSWAAWDVNRYNMQDKIHELVDLGIDPTLEEILET
jgi:serine/threonine protein kinase